MEKECKSPFLNGVSEDIGEHQGGSMEYVCADCRETFNLKFSRTGPDTMDMEGGHVLETNVNRPGLEYELLIKCPACFAKKPFREGNEIYSRVVGFLRPISSWNNGKQEEWKLRKTSKPEDLDTKNETQEEIFERLGMLEEN